MLSGQGRTFVTTLLSFGFELPTSIGGVALLVYVVKLRGPTGLLWITWAGGGFSAVELVVLAAIILCGDWARYAIEAKRRQEAASASNTSSTDDGDAAAGGPAAEDAAGADAASVRPLPPADGVVARPVDVVVAVPDTVSALAGEAREE